MALDYDIPSLFRFEQRAESPVLPDGVDEGIRINAASVAYDGAVLHFDLTITCGFARSFVAAFHRFPDAFVFALEDAETGRAAVGRCVDPHKRYPSFSGPNFKGYAPEPSPKSFSTQWTSIPLAVPLVRRAAHPTFFATVFLQEHVSNSLGFNVWDGSVTSYLAGIPSPVVVGAELEEEGDESDDGDDAAEEPAPPREAPLPPAQPARRGGAALYAAAPRFGPGGPLWFEGSLAVTPDELAKGGGDGWLRSLFVTATRQDSQASKIVAWLGDAIAFPADLVRYGPPGEELYGTSFRFDLASLLGARPPEGVYYVQLSARHHRSKMVMIQCG
jgi:hypothetical protein